MLASTTRYGLCMADTAPTEAAPEITTGEKVAETAPVETTELSPRLQKVKEFGFENVKDENEAFDRLLAALQDERQKNEQFDSRLQQVLEQVNKPPVQPTTTQVQEAQDAPWWNPP